MSLPPLGEPVRQDCPCCGLPTTIELREVTDSPACPNCKKHGSDADLRDRIHLQLWSATAKRIAEEHIARERILEARVVELEETNERLREHIVDQYKADIFEDLIEKLSSDVVLDAQRARDSALSREAEVMSMLLLDVEPNHRGKQGKDSRCACGRLTSGCAEWRIIEPFRVQLKVWEGKQLKRMKEGKHHGLPRRHPEVAKSKAEFLGLDDHFAQPFGAKY